MMLPRRQIFRRLSAASSLLVNDAKYKVGDKSTLERLVSADDVEKFARLSGDTNPIHRCRCDSTKQGKAVVHGALLNGLVSGVIGTKLPGPGTVLVSQELTFPNKCYAGDLVRIDVEVVEMRKIIKLQFTCKVNDKVVLHGHAKVVHKTTN